MNYAGIILDDITNGPGIRTSLFVSGCRNNCEGCFNKDAQDFNYGKKFTVADILKIINSVDNDYHSGITLLGGDPMEFENALVLVELAKDFKIRYTNNKTIWTYTGYTFEYINSLSISDPRRELLYLSDVVVDGPFMLDLKDISLTFRGSSNQRIIDMKETKRLNSSKPILLSY